MNMTKGLEIELYTGHADGRIIGLSHEIARRLDGFVCEPDARNTEYVTEPHRGIDALRWALLGPRRALRALLAELGGATIVPGSALPLAGDADRFIRSDPDNPYHEAIERAYGTRVVTTSIHFNFGVDDTDALMRACRLLRMDAPVALALTASSPFLNGQATGMHSTRWHTFPQTPPRVPLFENHAHYIRFMEEQLALGTMWNVRHLWCSARPNGPNRPFEVDRLEVRICDLTLDIPLTLAVALLLEHRIQVAMDGLDPLRGRHSESALRDIMAQNEQAVARDSLDALLVDWQTGRRQRARDVVSGWLDELRRHTLSFDERSTLTAVDLALDRGNDAMRWLSRHRRGDSIEAIMRDAILETRTQEDALTRQLS